MNSVVATTLSQWLTTDCEKCTESCHDFEAQGGKTEFLSEGQHPVRHCCPLSMLVPGLLVVWFLVGTLFAHSHSFNHAGARWQSQPNHVLSAELRDALGALDPNDGRVASSSRSWY